MKTPIVALLIIFCISGSSCQTQTSELTRQRSQKEQAVALLLQNNGQGPVFSMSEKEMNRLGDAAAQGVIEFLGERKATVNDDVTSVEEIKRILAILQMAFDAPGAIQLDENKYPKATMILLRYLDSLPASKSVKPEIEETNHTIEQMKLKYNVRQQK